MSPSHGYAVKVIEIRESDQSFQLNEAALKKILHEIPENREIAIVSVVGAFRTGKSFALDFMLRYLRAGDNADQGDDNEPSQKWLGEGTALEANQNADLTKGADVLSASRSKQTNDTGFGWRSGKERCTTGIWMWSESFERTLPDGKKIQVLLIDTQGMFDSTLGQMLTASIFGLSTLISSYQIYNVEKRIQEDNLQHLALFTEYGRVALEEQLAADRNNNIRPFQRLEFLVRDWPSFDDENGKLSEMRASMSSYLDEVLQAREHKDLQQVREQISKCFDEVSCYLLPHPGLEITNKTYDGNVGTIRPEFRRLFSDYVRRVFSTNLVPKRLNGRSVTGPELFNLIKAYCTLFREAKIFPEAKTLLAATAEANNRSALELAQREYRKVLDKATKQYVEEPVLKAAHAEGKASALEAYDKMASIGPKDLIATFRTQLEKEIKELLEEYTNLNRLRDPFGFVAPYIVPLLLAVAAYVFRIFIDLTCSSWSSMCMSGSNFLSQSYSVVFFFMLFHFLSMGHGVRHRLEQMIGLLGNRVAA